MEDNKQQKKWYQKWWVWIIVVLLLSKIPMEAIKTILIIIGILIVVVLFLSKKSNEQSAVQLQPEEKEENKSEDMDYDESDDCYDEFEDADKALIQNTVSNATENVIKDIAKNTPSKKIKVKDKDIYVIEQPKKRHFGWMLWVIAVILSLFLMVYSRNKISPFILIIGVIGVIFSGSLLWKILTEKNPEIQALNKGRAKYVSILLITCMIMTLSGYFTLRIRNFNDFQREKSITNITVKGADENTAPLAVYDLKLLNKGEDYTVICTLKKTSSSPESGFFKFTIALIDKNGRQINSADIINTLDTYSELFAYGSTYRFEQNISVSKDKNRPVIVEFLNIKECDEKDYIKYLLDKARKEISYKFYNSAKQYIQQALAYDPDNEDAKSLMEQIEKADTESPSNKLIVQKESLDSETNDIPQIDNKFENEYISNPSSHTDLRDTPQKIDRTGYIYDINQTTTFDNSKITIHRLKICDDGYNYAVFDYTIVNESNSILTWNLKEHDNVFGYLTIDTYETERLCGNTFLKDDDFSLQTRKQSGKIEPHCTYYGSLLLLFYHWDEHYKSIPIYSNESMTFELYYNENETKYSYTIQLNK